MSTIFVVYAVHDYQGESAVRAFVSLDAAESFKDELAAYQALRPAYPEEEETDENEALFDQYRAAEEQWMDNHPAGSWSADGFAVGELELTP